MTSKETDNKLNPDIELSNCAGNCPACTYARGPTGTEGCTANPRELCYELMITRRELEQLRSQKSEIPPSD